VSKKGGGVPKEGPISVYLWLIRIISDGFASFVFSL
jgi:hypothetical protein